MEKKRNFSHLYHRQENKNPFGFTETVVDPMFPVPVLTKKPEKKPIAIQLSLFA